MRRLGKTLLMILKIVAFLIGALIIGIIPAYCCVWLGSWILLFLGITVSETAGNTIMVILAFLIGGYSLADTLDIKFTKGRR